MKTEKNKAAAQLGQRGGKAFVEKHGREELLKRLAKAREVRMAKIRQRQGVVNLDEPERNCRTCGLDHAYKTADNEKSYCDRCNPEQERICPKDNFKYMPGGKCPCWR